MNTYLRWTKIILIGLLVISIASCDRDTDDDRVEPSDITIVEPVPDDDRVEPPPNAVIVDIPDVNLRKAIASELNIVDDTAITAEDMQKLTRLKCKEASVEDLFNQVLAVEQMAYVRWRLARSSRWYRAGVETDDNRTGNAAAVLC